MTTQARTASTVQPLNIGRLAQFTLIAAIGAAVANLIVFVIATGILNIPIIMEMPPGSTPAPLEAFPVALSSALPAIGAAIVVALLIRFTARPATIFIVIAVVFLLLSMGGPLALPIADSAKAVLALMHIVAAVVIGGVLARFAGEYQ